MSDRLDKLAEQLAHAWRSGGTIPLPETAAAPKTRAEAYAVQDRMAKLIGGKIAGWKVGATVKAVQMFEGHDGPLPGRVFADRCFDSPARAEARLLPNAKIECEFAFKLTKDLPVSSAPIRPVDIAGSMTFHPAIEISANRYAPGTGNRGTTTFDGIADNGSGGAAVLGPAVADWQRLAFETMEIDARIDGSPPLQAYGGVYRRHPLEIAAETFSDLHKRGIGLERGHCLLTGSLTLPTALRKGQTLEVKFANLPKITLTLV